MHLVKCEECRSLVQCKAPHCDGKHSLAECPKHGTIAVFDPYLKPPQLRKRADRRMASPENG